MYWCTSQPTGLASALLLFREQYGGETGRKEEWQDADSWINTSRAYALDEEDRESRREETASEIARSA